MKHTVTVLFILLALPGVAQKTTKDTTFNIGDLIKIPKVEFPTWCYGCPDGIALGTKDSLEVIGRFVAKYPGYIFQIESHTDQRGAAKANWELSQNRANSVRNYLINNFAVDSLQVSAVGFGASTPIYTAADIIKVKSPEEKENLHAANRRLVLRVTGKK